MVLAPNAPLLSAMRVLLVHDTRYVVASRSPSDYSQQDYGIVDIPIVDQTAPALACGSFREERVGRPPKRVGTLWAP